MTPEKALNLVRKYSEYTKRIKKLKKNISDNLNLCNGTDGKRQDILNRKREYDSRNRETTIHLYNWYQDIICEKESAGIYEFIHKEICPHCYAAHEAIQERKKLRLKLGQVKSYITRFGLR